VPIDHGPPFPLTRDELKGLATNGLELVALEDLSEPRGPIWRGEYRRPTSGRTSN
jgi:hypothetical protein